MNDFSVIGQNKQINIIKTEIYTDMHVSCIHHWQEFGFVGYVSDINFTCLNPPKYETTFHYMRPVMTHMSWHVSNLISVYAVRLHCVWISAIFITFGKKKNLSFCMWLKMAKNLELKRRSQFLWLSVIYMPFTYTFAFLLKRDLF